MSLKSSAKCEIRSVIRYLVVKGKSSSEVFNEIKSVYGEGVMNLTSVFKWCHEFKNGRTTLHTSSPSTKKFKTTISSKKIMAFVFRDHKGIILIEFFTSG